ncbi:UbiX family flavin prenyltransferase [Desulfovibrio litoralis]|uniref:Flavin prenyltransferase UbiX n=1 Tax=Desulfovibrio litoralis DSM 11393 TaxID=1121455 RepID=A0A1M7T6J5_9BACT|nr:UbiX family flavin prenyltransferase [Desulfovibrio litoralis]SHN66305.1 4-hydroxy-3-polyprenylbenzoate decarboxylase [Desulfovibrio litoralis DSM 11393]
MQKIIVGVSGASGMPFAFSLLTSLKKLDIQIHLIVSDSAKQVLALEHDQDYTEDKLKQLADCVYSINNMGAAIASGSWGYSNKAKNQGSCLGMVICPCSMSSLASIAHGINSNLLHRAADVTLKERRKLVLVPRETPFSSLHLENMLKLSGLGAVIMPPCLAFYTQKPQSEKQKSDNNQELNDLIQNFSGRVLDQFGIEHDLCSRWGL